MEQGRKEAKEGITLLRDPDEGREKDADVLYTDVPTRWPGSGV